MWVWKGWFPSLPEDVHSRHGLMFNDFLWKIENHWSLWFLLFVALKCSRRVLQKFPSTKSGIVGWNHWKIGSCAIGMRLKRAGDYVSFFQCDHWWPLASSSSSSSSSPSKVMWSTQSQTIPNQKWVVKFVNSLQLEVWHWAWHIILKCFFPTTAGQLIWYTICHKSQLS